MLDSKPFWIFLDAIVAVIWVTALALLLSGHSHHWFVWFAEFVAVIHALEIPFAFRVLAGRRVSSVRICLLTLIFGFTWWLPVRRGVYAAA